MLNSRFAINVLEALANMMLISVSDKNDLPEKNQVTRLNVGEGSLNCWAETTMLARLIFLNIANNLKL